MMKGSLVTTVTHCRASCNRNGMAVRFFLLPFRIFLALYSLSIAKTFFYYYYFSYSRFLG